MIPNDEIKAAAKLAEPFDGAAFAGMRGLSAQEGSDILSQLQGMSWLTSEYDSATGGVVYRLTDSVRAQVNSGGFG